jgi:predicted nuclease with RNAse H fold
MRTIGIDLAAEPNTTAVAAIDWRPGAAQVVDIEVPANDNALLRHAGGADKAGIDCPLGWPDTFLAFLRDHRENAGTLAEPGLGAEWRRSLAYRRTDEHVRKALNIVPLSVSTDRIGLTAMRAARLQVLLAKEGHVVDRAGSGLIVEVYPAAGLNCWQLKHRGYKGSKRLTELGELVTSLSAAAPWLDLGPHEALCRRSDHAFDAVIAALLARAAACGKTTAPAPDDLAVARREGWIALPTRGLGELV